MNIIVVEQFGASLRRFDFSRRTATLGVAGILLLAMLVGGAISVIAFQNLVVESQIERELAALQAHIDRSQIEISDSQESTQMHLNALAVQLAQLKARTARLDAVGSRLTELGELSATEFDFTMIPAAGGPSEPLAYGAATAISIAQDIERMNGWFSDRGDKLDVLEDLLASRELSESLAFTRRPVETGWLSSGFGRRFDPFTGDPAMHRGVDFSAPMGSPVLAVAAGIVSYSGTRQGYGNVIDIEHGDGTVTRYAHNQRNIANVGDRVRGGDQIATVGRTGRATGPHLHFEVLKQGRQINPTPFISAVSK